MTSAAKISAMRQQTAFAIACGVTAFLLVGGSAVITNWRSSAAAADIAAVSPSPAPTATTADAARQERAVFLAREAVYQQRLAEANRRLAEANQRLSAASATIAAEPAVVATAVVAEQAADQPITAARTRTKQKPLQITADKAGQIALAIGSRNGAASVQRNELVLFQGVPAYEVVLANGVVYVDAASGSVLFSAWTPTPVPVATPENDNVAAVPPSSSAPAPDSAPAPALEAPTPVVEDEEHGDDEHEEDREDEHEEEHPDE